MYQYTCNRKFKKEEQKEHIKYMKKIIAKKPSH